MAEGEGFISRVLHRLGGKSSLDNAPTLGNTTPDQSTVPQNPTLGRANVLDEAARTFPSAVGGLKTTPPTAEGFARAQDAVTSTQPTPPTPGTPTQGS